MIHNPHSDIYIASCSVDGGIYHYSFFSDGHLEFKNKTVLDRPMYMSIEGNKMYTLLRAPFEENDESALVVYDIDAEGYLLNPSELASTKGQVACHLTVKKGTPYCVNYISGSVIKMPETVVSHCGKGSHPIRQASPHTHFVGYTPDNEFVCVTDLGLDTIYLYTPDLELVSKASVPTGSGARHLVFSDDGEFCFVVNELLSTVSSFSYKYGELTYVETIHIIPEDFRDKSTASAIRYSNGKIYVSNRGHNSISVIEHLSGYMNLCGMIDCGGDFPRDFDIVDDYLISTNEKSDSVTVIDLNSHELVEKINGIKAPICIIGR